MDKSQNNNWSCGVINRKVFKGWNHLTIWNTPKHVLIDEIEFRWKICKNVSQLWIFLVTYYIGWFTMQWLGGNLIWTVKHNLIVMVTIIKYVHEWDVQWFEYSLDTYA
jgi:hypothetical protein